MVHVAHISLVVTDIQIECIRKLNRIIEDNNGDITIEDFNILEREHMSSVLTQLYECITKKGL